MSKVVLFASILMVNLIGSFKSNGQIISEIKSQSVVQWSRKYVGNINTPPK